MRHSKQVSYGIVIALSAAVAIALFAAFYLGFSHNFGDSVVYSDPPVSLTEGWSTGSDESRTPVSPFPGRLTVKDQLLLYRTLPNALPSETVLCIETNHQTLRVWADGNLIFTNGVIEYQSTGEVLADKWNLVPLPVSAGGKDLKIELSSPLAGIEIPVYPILLGSRSSVIISLLKDNISILFFGLIALLLVLFLLSLALATSRSKITKGAYKGPAYLGVFVLLATVWILTDAKILQFFIRNVALIYYLSFFSFMLMPVPFLLYIKEIITHEKKAFYLCAGLFLLNFFVCLSLYLARVIVMPQVTFSTHLLIIGSLVCVVYYSWREVRLYREKDLTTVLWGTGILFLCGLLSLAQFYLRNQGGSNSLLFRYGLLLFLILLSITAVKRSVNLYQTASEARMYKKMAYLDSLTHLANRAAFNRDMALLEGRYQDHKTVALIILDLNKLKTINDTYGHSCGDIAISAASDCICTAFQRYGTCYRIGGDEFAVILTDRSKAELDNSIHTLKTAIREYNEKAHIPIDLAWGYALSAEESGACCACDLFDLADEKMYCKKRKDQSKPSKAKE